MFLVATFLHLTAVVAVEQTSLLIPLSLVSEAQLDSVYQEAPSQRGASTECALILRRLAPKYVNKSYAPSFKAMLEALRGMPV